MRKFRQQMYDVETGEIVPRPKRKEAKMTDEKAEVEFKGRLVQIGAADALDPSELKGETVMVFVVSPEDIRACFTIFRRQVQVQAQVLP